MTKLHSLGKYIRIVPKVYWEQTACIRVENVNANIDMGVIQGYAWKYSDFTVRYYWENYKSYHDSLLADIFLINWHIVDLDKERKLHEIINSQVKENRE